MNIAKNYPVMLFLLLGAVAVAAGISRQKLAAESNDHPETEKALAVKATPAGDLKKYAKQLSYQALVVGEREATIAAKASGTVEEVRAEAGMEIASGALLARIDDGGALLSTGNDLLASSQVRQGEIALKESRKNYEQAKDSYENIRKDNASSESERDAARLRRDLAKLQKESADISLQAVRDTRLITAPLAGTVLERFVSNGDSVSIGTPLFKIGTADSVRVRFFVEEEALDAFPKGARFTVSTPSGETIAALVKVRAQAADSQSGRFLVEALPEKPLRIGTVVTVHAALNLTASAENSLLVPVSLLTTTQNGNFLFVAENGKAVQKMVQISKVNGEIAEIRASMADETLIITQGAKLLSDGAAISLN